MKVGIEPTDREPRKAVATLWLKRVLETPRLEGIELPSTIRGVIYIDETPRYIHRGSWQLDSSEIYLANASAGVDMMQRLGILASVANITGAIADPAIIELLSSKLVSSIKDSVTSVYSSFIASTVKPSRLAINTEQAQVAAELSGNWFLTGGAPAEVNETWITMDF